MNKGLVESLMGLPIFEAEWVLWLLLLLSLVSIAAIIERTIFFIKHRIDVSAIRDNLAKSLDKGDYEAAAKLLKGHDTMETNVVLFGLREHEKGPEAVEDLMAGAMSREKLRHERFLTFLGTVGSNSPFIGLFGTVLGIIKAFADLAGNIAEASSVVMAGISEALIATAIGLLVAIPAVIAHNTFRALVKRSAGNTELLARTLLAQLKSEEPVGSGKE
jgi:biopolymer transport protein ExbB